MRHNAKKNEQKEEPKLGSNHIALMANYRRRTSSRPGHLGHSMTDDHCAIMVQRAVTPHQLATGPVRRNSSKTCKEVTPLTVGNIFNNSTDTTKKWTLFQMTVSSFLFLLFIVFFFFFFGGEIEPRKQMCCTSSLMR